MCMCKKERKYVSDKRILAYNPFEYLDENLFDFMDGYTFLDYLKINRAICTSFSTSVNRPSNSLYSYGVSGPVTMDTGATNIDIDLRMSLQQLSSGMWGHYIVNGDKYD